MTAFRSTVTPLPVPPGWKHTKKDPSPRSQSIKQLINDALEVQDGLNTVKNLLAQLEPDETVSKLVVIALGCQDKFFNLLAVSRDSASILMAHMEDFTQNIVPLVQDGTVSLSDKLIEVKGSAEMISTTAQQSPLKTQEQLEELKTDLNILEKRVIEWTEELELDAQAPMRELSEKIKDLESQLTEALSLRGRALAMAMNVTHWSMTSPRQEPLSLHRYRLPRPDGSKLSSYIVESTKAFADIKALHNCEATTTAATQELEQRRRELEQWREDIASKLRDVKRALECLRTVKQHFTVLDDKLGNFEDIWDKLMKDIQALNDHLENPWSGGTEEEFEDRIHSEGVVYQEIRGALEMYAIQSQRSTGFGVPID